MKKTIMVVCFSLIWLGSIAQTAVSGENTDSLRKEALNVFMSASDYIRKEITYVNYVRDIKDADVYIITTGQGTGSGGYEYSIFLVGQNRCAGMSDTITYTTLPDATTDEKRQKEVLTLKIGLMRYVAKTPLSDYIKISFSEPLKETVTTDEWDNWVFTPSFSMYFNSEKSYKYRNFSGSFSANRITQEWKIRFNLTYNYNASKYIIGSRVITSDYDTKWARAMAVKSITDHWSYGATTIFGSSTYNNQDIKFQFMPGVEYNVYPYSQSTRKQFRILYKFGYNYVDYTDTTIYNKTKENLWLHNLTTSYTIIQKWGSLNGSIVYSNYFHDWSKNNLDFYASISMRIFKGLSLNLYGYYSIIHDQLGLVKGDASTEEVLLQRRELETQYSFYINFGFSYTFGSIYNNVVNPRFGSGF